jgi:hypothetical protein
MHLTEQVSDGLKHKRMCTGGIGGTGPGSEKILGLTSVSKSAFVKKSWHCAAGAMCLIVV